MTQLGLEAAYGEGYAAGKEKAFFEMARHAGSGHAFKTCGCEPCKVWRAIEGHILQHQREQQRTDCECEACKTVRALVADVLTAFTPAELQAMARDRGGSALDRCRTRSRRRVRR